MTRKSTKSYLSYFLAFYALYYASAALNGTYFPVYLAGMNISNTTMGIILSSGFLISILSQPIWGLASDRGKSKNAVLSILVILGAISYILIPLSKNIIYIVIAFAVFTFFENPISPIYDSITLEYTRSRQLKFGYIRIAGTVGYSFILVIMGVLIKRNIEFIFPIFFIVSICGFAVTLWLPKVKGYQFDGNRVSLFSLFSNKTLVILLIFDLVIQSTIGFYNSFFPIYYKHIGADDIMLGWAVFFATISETPFLLTGENLIKKIGIKYMLISSAGIAAIRWILLYIIVNPFMILPLQFIHGLTFIVFNFTLILYINENVPKELRSSGQAVNALITTGIAPIIGNILGGLLSDIIGIKQVFLFSTILIISTIIIVLIVTYNIDRQRTDIANE